MALPQSGWDEISTMTNRLWMPGFQDGILTQTPYLDRMRARSAKRFSGGLQLVIPQNYVAGSSGDYYRMEELNVDDADQFAPFISDWKQSYSWVTIAELDELVNSGSETQMLDFVKSKTEVARRALHDRVNLNALSANTASSKGQTGIRTAIATGNTYFGIDRSTNTWANANIDSTTTQLNPRPLTAMWNLCGTNGKGEFPTLHLTTSLLWQIYHSVVLPFDRIADPKIANLGFGGLTFMGKPVVWDPGVVAASWYMINEDHNWLYQHSQRPLVKFTGWKEPLRQDGRIGFFLFLGQFVFDSPRTCGALTALTN